MREREREREGEVVVESRCHEHRRREFERGHLFVTGNSGTNGVD